MELCGLIAGGLACLGIVFVAGQALARSAARERKRMHSLHRFKATYWRMTDDQLREAYAAALVLWRGSHGPDHEDDENVVRLIAQVAREQGRHHLCEEAAAQVKARIPRPGAPSAGPGPAGGAPPRGP